jgi:hypothetical protein
MICLSARESIPVLAHRVQDMYRSSNKGSHMASFFFVLERNGDRCHEIYLVTDMELTAKKGENALIAYLSDSEYSNLLDPSTIILVILLSLGLTCRFGLACI